MVTSQGGRGGPRGREAGGRGPMARLARRISAALVVIPFLLLARRLSAGYAPTLHLLSSKYLALSHAEVNGFEVAFAVGQQLHRTLHAQCAQVVQRGVAHGLAEALGGQQHEPSRHLGEGGFIDLP